jgi:hypothetical protein
MGVVMCHPFEPFTEGYTALTTGGVTSLNQAVEPVEEESPLVDATATNEIGPAPCPRLMLQEFPGAQVKGAPFIVPEIVTANP